MKRPASLLGPSFGALLLAAGCAPAGPVDLEATGPGGVSFRLSAAALVEGPNDLAVEATSGAAPAGGALVLTATMPAMSHGGAAYEGAETAPGTFAVDDVVLNMPGTWAVSVSLSGPTPDEASFSLEVP